MLVALEVVLEHVQVVNADVCSRMLAYADVC
jgi:hypothetical protein